MRKTTTLLALLLALVACSNDTNPVTGGKTDSGTTDGTGSGSDGSSDTGGLSGDGLPPGTANPSSRGRIARFEDGSDAEFVEYRRDGDKIVIDNLPFDGDGVYDRDDQVPRVGSAAVYENNNTTERRAYKALYAVGPSGDTRYAVVRTGDYEDYGYGGFVYQRDVGVVLPTSGQATYAGDYSGIRVAKGTGKTAGDLTFVEGDVDMIADFEDFDTGDAVEGSISSRLVRSSDGVLIGSLPTLKVRTTGITDAGELVGIADAELSDTPSPADELAAGNWYAILSGDKAEEMVGVLVMDEADVQETGGFILVKQP